MPTFEGSFCLFDDVEGFSLEADRCIKDLTIVTEYTGDVENRESDDGVSMMALLSVKDPSRSLVICPDKHSNIARFISGISNHTPDGRKKQNLKCSRFDVDGECRVLLIAIRDISKGGRDYTMIIMDTNKNTQQKHFVLVIFFTRHLIFEITMYFEISWMANLKPRGQNPHLLFLHSSTKNPPITIFPIRNPRNPLDLFPKSNICRWSLQKNSG